MSYTVRLTDTAKQDLREITFWVAEQSRNIEIAKRFCMLAERLYKKPEAFPNKGIIPKDRVIRSEGYRFIVHKEYLIIYLVNEKEQLVNMMATFIPKKIICA